MVGSTVDKYDCESKVGGLGNAIDGLTTPSDFVLNATLPPENSTYDYGFTTPESLPELPAVTECKVKVAAAVTFVGGALQVALC